MSKWCQITRNVMIMTYIGQRNSYLLKSETRWFSSKITMNSKISIKPCVYCVYYKFLWDRRYFVRYLNCRMKVKPCSCLITFVCQKDGVTKIPTFYLVPYGKVDIFNWLTDRKKQEFLQQISKLTRQSKNTSTSTYCTW